MVVQYIIVALILCASAFYLAKTIYRSSKGHACETGSCKCGPALKK